MRQKPDIATKKLLPWDEYKSKSPDQAAASIYARVESTSTTIIGWYWRSIKTKRWTSLGVRLMAFVLLIPGTALPILSAVLEKTDLRLALTQIAVALLAVAGLLQVADKVFGWSSGWMRYIATATSMENLTRTFELEWAKLLIQKISPLDESDIKALFDLAKGLEQNLLKLQAEETGKWVSDFSAGISLLDSLIKTQREETEKKLEALQTAMTAQKDAIKAEEKGKQPGALEVSLIHKAEPKPLKISVDREEPATFIGYSWSKMNLAPGQHELLIQVCSEPPLDMEKIIEVSPGVVARVEIKVPP
jgi:hypothetical protein